MNQATLPTEDLVQNVEEQGADQPKENGKRKRQMSERQLAALAEGRKKRWLKKQEAKEEPLTASESEESTDQSSSESEESNTGTETQSDHPSTAQESGESSSSSAHTESSGQSDSSEEESKSESESESESEEEEPPSPLVLRRQKATHKEQKNQRAAEKLFKYIQAKAQPFFSTMSV